MLRRATVVIVGQGTTYDRYHLFRFRYSLCYIIFVIEQEKLLIVNIAVLKGCNKREYYKRLNKTMHSNVDLMLMLCMPVYLLILVLIDAGAPDVEI